MLSQHNDNIDINDKASRARQIASLAGQLTLAGIGLGAGILYIGPSTVCADTASCGKWLTELTSRNASIAVFSSGGLDFSLINAYFSGKSIDGFINYIAKQKSISAKAGKGSAVIIYALAQNAGLLLVSMATSTAHWQTILTTAGGAPGALYGAVGLMENEIPSLISALKYHANALQYNIRTCFGPLSEEDLCYRERMQYYHGMQGSILSQINANWQKIVTRSRHLDHSQADNPLAYLMNERVEVQKPSYLKRAMHGFSMFTGVSLTGLLSAAFTKSTVSIMADYIPSFPLRAGIAAFLSSSSIYGNWKLIVGGMNNLMDSVYHLINGDGINSLAFQLRPKTSTVATLLCLTTSLLSYAVINLVYENEFNREDYNRTLYETGRFSAIFAMNFYHFAGLFHFYQLMLSSLSKDEKEQFIFAMEREVERFNRMTLEEFIEFVERNPEQAKVLGATAHQPVIDESARLLDLTPPADMPALQANSLFHQTEQKSDASGYNKSYSTFPSANIV